MTTLVAIICMVLAVPLLWLFWNLFLWPWRVAYHRRRAKEGEFTPKMQAEVWARIEEAADARDRERFDAAE